MLGTEYIPYNMSIITNQIVKHSITWTAFAHVLLQIGTFADGVSCLMMNFGFDVVNLDGVREFLLRNLHIGEGTQSYVRGFKVIRL